MSGVLYAITLATALGCGVVAGVFFAFSSFVMQSLGDLPPQHGMTAMQSINRRAVTPAFMLALFGTAALCLGLLVWSVIEAELLVLAATALYLVGTIGVTMARNVPLNNALEAAGPDELPLWRRYLVHWTGWNHLRAFAALAAAALLIVALVQG
jgi:uncharacterized membrane protein